LLGVYGPYCVTEEFIICECHAQMIFVIFRGFQIHIGKTLIWQCILNKFAVYFIS
jgi:hypothetical protein